MITFKPDGSNGCHDVLMICMNLNDVTISNSHGVGFPCIISGISSETIGLLKKC